MDGKVLIYGGSGAVGSAAARLLKKMGYKLHLVGSTEATLKAIPDGAGGRYEHCRCPGVRIPSNE